MINTSKQDWTIGATVKVGFLTLTVVGAIPTPKDGRPDTYLLRRADQMYTFTPHCGLAKIDADEAQAMVDSAQRIASMTADAALAKAQRTSDLINRFGARAMRTLTAALFVPVLRLTGYRFSRSFRRGDNLAYRVVYACIDTVQANVWAGM